MGTVIHTQEFTTMENCRTAKTIVDEYLDKYGYSHNSSYCMQK